MSVTAIVAAVAVAAVLVCACVVALRRRGRFAWVRPPGRASG
ncbi:hypothetical protein [Nonomuraea rubra]